MSKILFFFDKKYFDYYKKQKLHEGKKIFSITPFLDNFEMVAEVDNSSDIIDISAFKGLNELQRYAEVIIPKFDDDTVFIADSKYKERFTFELRYCFDAFQDLEIINNINVEFSEIKSSESYEIKKHKKVIDLNKNQLNTFLDNVSSQIYGHEKFKKDLEKLITRFILFNKLGEHKVLSLFLMGGSGVGKTHVAKAIHNALEGKKKIAKINFGNYSSDHSLSSLIGSPRGYTGSEDGEIFIRVKKTDTGVILIDEFEKSNAKLFNYFLDVLETGVMTSSLSDDENINGFIIIFTSNIKKDEFSKRISPELRSRFDYVGFFNFLSNLDKEKFVEFRVKDIIKNYNNIFKNKLTDNIVDTILNLIDVTEFNNLRDLDKKIKEVFMLQVMTIQ